MFTCGTPAPLKGCPAIGVALAVSVGVGLDTAGSSTGATEGDFVLFGEAIGLADFFCDFFFLAEGLAFACFFFEGEGVASSGDLATRFFFAAGVLLAFGVAFGEGLVLAGDFFFFGLGVGVGVSSGSEEASRFVGCAVDSWACPSEATIAQMAIRAASQTRKRITGAITRQSCAFKRAEEQAQISRSTVRVHD